MMPAAKSMALRRRLVEQHQAGASLASLARELDIAYGAARNIWRQFRQEGQITPHYANCRHTGVRKGGAVYSAAVQLKQAHPGWGAGLIRIELAGQFDEHDLPSERTLQRWFRRAGVGRAAGDQRARVQVQRGRQAHEVWAVDAKEQIRLGDGNYVSWLTITDEGSGAILNAVLFPHSLLDADRPAAGQTSPASDDEPVGTPGALTDG